MSKMIEELQEGISRLSAENARLKDEKNELKGINIALSNIIEHATKNNKQQKELNREMVEVLERLLNLAANIGKAGKGKVATGEWEEAWELAEQALQKARGE